MKTSTLAVAVVSASLAVGVSFSAFAADSMKLGAVDYVKVFQQVPQGKDTLNQLKAELQPQIDKLKTTQAGIEQQVKDLNVNAPTMTKEAHAQKEQALQDQEEAFQKSVMALQHQEARKEHMAAARFNRDMDNAIRQVAMKDHLDMVLNSQATPYVASEYDVTAQVVAVMKDEMK